MSEPAYKSIVSKVEEWTAVVQEYLDRGLIRNGTVGVLAAARASERSYFEEQVLPLLLDEDFETPVVQLETLFPWLLEFRQSAQSDFPKTLGELQRDSDKVLGALSTYCRLADFVKTKKCLAPSLRVWIQKEAKTLKKKEEQEEHDDVREFWKSTIETHRQAIVIKDEIENDNDFLKKMYKFNPEQTEARFKDVWRDGDYPEHVKAQPLQPVLSNIRTLADMLSPAEGGLAEADFSKCLSVIRLAMFRHLPDSKEQLLNARIEQLEKDKTTLGDKLRHYQRMISDLGFRHLTEKLPVHAGTPGTKPTIRWHKFWDQAWNNNGAGPKTSSPLYALWNGSDNISRSSIDSAGKGLFSVFSANIHGFGNAFDPQALQRDQSQGKILQMLKPRYFVGQDVDWDKEFRRFI